MKADELDDFLALFGVEIEAGKEAGRKLDALARVLAGAASFAGVVEQQREQKDSVLEKQAVQMKSFLPLVLGHKSLEL